MTDTPLDAPDFAQTSTSRGLELQLTGMWTICAIQSVEVAAQRLRQAAGAAQSVALDLSKVTRLDTAGAWLIDRTRVELADKGAKITLTGLSPDARILLQEAHYRAFAAPPTDSSWGVLDLLSDVGHSLVDVTHDIFTGVAFLGQIVSSFLAMALNPAKVRLTSIVFHVENFGLRALPIVALINFLVGCIVAQQGLYQLRRFGAATFTVDLIGILVLRELAVLLTSIMIAGRSGSAITAELGSMKMREEIDALRVMGLDPVDVLVMPRLIALLIALPLLTFLADLSALFGGLVVSWIYGSISPEIFLARLKDAIGINTLVVGLLKAPVMALVIGIISSIEGFGVKGSAESLGQHVTMAVVKSIFMVILVDGLFAVFFVYVHY